jgi:hypothetical protein
MALQSLLFAGGFTLGFAFLTLAPRWVQVVVTGAGSVLGLFVIASAIGQLDGRGLLAGLMLIGFCWGIDALLVALRRPVISPSVGAPGGADAPGGHGKRDGERDAPRLPHGVSSTAGRAGRPRSFSGRVG